MPNQTLEKLTNVLFKIVTSRKLFVCKPKPRRNLYKRYKIVFTIK